MRLPDPKDVIRIDRVWAPAARLKQITVWKKAVRESALERRWGSLDHGLVAGTKVQVAPGQSKDSEIGDGKGEVVAGSRDGRLVTVRWNNGYEGTYSGDYVVRV